MRRRSRKIWLKTDTTTGRCGIKYLVSAAMSGWTLSDAGDSRNCDATSSGASGTAANFRTRSRSSSSVRRSSRVPRGSSGGRRNVGAVNVVSS